MDSDEDDDNDDGDDEDDEVVGKLENIDTHEFPNNMLSPEDAKRQGELAEGVKKIKLKRQHSTEAVNTGSPATRKSPASNSPTTGTTPPTASDISSTPPSLLTNAAFERAAEALSDEAIVGSPLKKQRASLSGIDDEAMRKRLGLGVSGGIGDVLGRINQSDAASKKVDEDEEL